MNLHDTIEQYIAWRRLHGAKFETGSLILRRFLKYTNGNGSCDDVTCDQARVFLVGNRMLTSYRAQKYSVLAGLYRYAICRGYASCSPLRDNEPRNPPRPIPYVFSHEELKRLFGAIEYERRNAVQLDAYTLRSLLRLLYGAGLRLSEALNLTLADVDLSSAVVTVHDSKFNKSRLVPIGSQLVDILREYSEEHRSPELREGKASYFLANRDGTRLVGATVRAAFAGLLHRAGIATRHAGQQSPRLHSLRHSFAVHRLTTWYQEGADVHRLLPALSTYMGHRDISGTQVYLSVTPELLQQASLRLEHHLKGENHE